jgi:hypothetical protein
VSYPEQRASLAREFGWSYETIDSMTFDQIHDALCDGKVERKYKVGAGTHENVLRLNRRFRRHLLGH